MNTSEDNTFLINSSRKLKEQDEQENKEYFNESLSFLVKAVIEKDVDKLLDSLKGLLLAFEDAKVLYDFIWARGRYQLGQIYLTENPFQVYWYSKQPRVPFNCKALPKGARLFEQGETPAIIVERVFKECYSTCNGNVKSSIRQWVKNLDLEWPFVPQGTGTPAAVEQDAGAPQTIKIPDGLSGLVRRVWKKSDNPDEPAALRGWLEQHGTRREQIEMLRATNPKIRKTDVAFILSMTASNVSKNWGGVNFLITI